MRQENLARKKESYRGGVGRSDKDVRGQPADKKHAHDLAVEKAAGGAQDERGARWRDDGWALEPQLKEFARDVRGGHGHGRRHGESEREQTARVGIEPLDYQPALRTQAEAR